MSPSVHKWETEARTLVNCSLVNDKCTLSLTLIELRSSEPCSSKSTKSSPHQINLPSMHFLFLEQKEIMFPQRFCNTYLHIFKDPHIFARARSSWLQWGSEGWRWLCSITLGGFTAKQIRGSAELGPATASGHMDSTPSVPPNARGHPAGACGGRFKRGAFSHGTQQQKRGVKIKIIPLCAYTVNLVDANTLKVVFFHLLQVFHMNLLHV